MSEREVMTPIEAFDLWEPHESPGDDRLTGEDILRVCKEYHRRMVEAEKRETISAEEQIRQAKESYGPNWIDHLLLAVIKANPILSHYVPKPKMSDKERIERALALYDKEMNSPAPHPCTGAASACKMARILRGESE